MVRGMGEGIALFFPAISQIAAQLMARGSRTRMHEFSYGAQAHTVPSIFHHSLLVTPHAFAILPHKAMLDFCGISSCVLCRAPKTRIWGNMYILQGLSPLTLPGLSARPKRHKTHVGDNTSELHHCSMSGRNKTITCVFGQVCTRWIIILNQKHIFFMSQGTRRNFEKKTIHEIRENSILDIDARWSNHKCRCQGVRKKPIKGKGRWGEGYGGGAVFLPRIRTFLWFFTRCTT